MKSTFTLTLTLTCCTALAAIAATPPATLAEAVTRGTTSFDLRLRYEHVDQDNALNPADALTLRARLGYTTAAYQGFTARFEAQHNADLIDDYAYAGGGKPGTSVVGDPPVTEVSQAWLAYAVPNTTATLGRQNWVLDNARFIGNVIWRQNYQTFDAFTVKSTPAAGVTVNYGYLWRIKRVFADTAVQPHWRSDSHALNISKSGTPGGTVTGYAYLLDFENSPANSCATYGASLVGSRKFDAQFSLGWRLEYATQQDYGPSPLSYRASYSLVELAPKFGGTTFTAGHEVLGSDRNAGFRTPLATLHALQGWADLFTTTPNAGVRDTYLKVSRTQGDFTFSAAHHWFEADANNSDYGTELDLLASWKFSKSITLLAKAAFYQAKTFSVDTTKFWLQADYRF